MAEEVVTDKNGLVYPCGVAPAVGDAKELAPGVWWLRMPMPFALDHINLWALRDGDGWALVDTGVAIKAAIMNSNAGNPAGSRPN